MNDRPVVPALLSVKGASKVFDGFRAVDNVSFDVFEGSITALIGPNGAGKSTLFNLITGKLAPSAGSILYQGRDITKESPEKRVRAGFGRTFQRTSIFPNMSLADNLRTALIAGRGVWALLGSAQSRFQIETVALLTRFGLQDKAGREAGTLSHGDQKNLELAMTLAQQPKVLLLDEPLAGMSPVETRQAVDTIVKEVRERGITLFFTEHDIDVVFSIADHIIVLDKGGVVASGTPQAIMQDAKVKAVYLGVDDVVQAAAEESLDA
jgi:branched-chain amino acid transport system ATP-binding protein